MVYYLDNRLGANSPSLGLDTRFGAYVYISNALQNMDEHRLGRGRKP